MNASHLGVGQKDRHRLYVLAAGAIGGGGGHVIVDRSEMYGDGPRNDPYSTEYDPAYRPDRDRWQGSGT